MLNKLCTLLVVLAKKQQLNIKQGIEHDIQELLNNNGYEKDENVQDWFLDLIDALVNQRLIKPTPFDFDERGKGDFVNLLADYSDLVPFPYENYGEAIQMSFETGMKATISFEGDTYEVSKR